MEEVSFKPAVKEWTTDGRTVKLHVENEISNVKEREGMGGWIDEQLTGKYGRWWRCKRTRGVRRTCRWVKYEQTVETGGRWSKPHVSTTSMRGLNALRRAIVDGHCSVSLDVATSGQFDVAG